MTTDREQDFQDQKVDPKLWKRLYGYTLRNKRYLIENLIAMFFVAVCDVCYPILTRFAIDRFINPGGDPSTQGIWLFAAGYIVLVIFQSCMTMTFIKRSGDIEMKMSYDIRQEAFEHLQNLSFSFYDKTSVGYLMARMVSDIGRISELISWSMIDILWSGFYIIFSVIAMFIFNWKLTLIVLVVIPPLAVISYILQKAILKYQRDARKQNSRITSAFNEGIMGAMTTKTLVREEANDKEFEEISTEYKKASIKAQVLSASFFPLIISLSAVSTALALILGGAGVSATLGGTETFIGIITAGMLVSFISYASSLFDPIQNLAGIFAELQSAQASAERVIGLLDTKSDISDR